MKHSLSRRDFIRISAASAGAVALGAYGLKQYLQAGEAAEYRETRPLLGTFISLKIVDTDAGRAKAAAAGTFAEIGRLEAVLSRHNPLSELSILNASGSLANASSELSGVLQKAQNIYSLTGGAFDASVLPLLDLFENWNWQAASGGAYTPPSDKDIAAKLTLVGFDQFKLSGRDITLGRPGMTLTLDGIAKGYIVDQAASLLRARGMASVLIAASGDMSLAGMRPDGYPWQIGIADPRALDPEAIFADFAFSNGCLATSGDYEHAFTNDFAWNHIIDPRLGHSPRELASATVLAPDAATADALATSAMVLGVSDSLDLFNRLSGVQAYLIGKDLKAHTTAGFYDVIADLPLSR